MNEYGVAQERIKCTDAECYGWQAFMHSQILKFIKYFVDFLFNNLLVLQNLLLLEKSEALFTIQHIDI